MTVSEKLGPAETIINTLVSLADHAVHNRPGIVATSPSMAVGVHWSPAILKREGDETKVYRIASFGNKKTARIPVGTLRPDGTVEGALDMRYMPPGLFPEVVEYYYRKISEVWAMDNEFAAKWASWAFKRDHRDLKVILCAFMLAQSRYGEPIREEGEVSFYDEDYRDVGEAMCLVTDKDHYFNPKMVLRVGKVLELPCVAKLNRELGFGRSNRTPCMGRYYAMVTKWLRYREQNPHMLKGLVRAGFKETVKELSRKVGYKPGSSEFFQILGWKQKQSPDGRREIGLHDAVTADSWSGLSEEEICQRIEKDRPDWKVIVGKIPQEVGVTQAVLAAAIEHGCLSSSDLIILSPTLEDLGLLKVPEIKEAWDAACAEATNRRAANIARRVKSSEVKEALEATADDATARAMEKVTKDLRIYVVVDKSGSMEESLSTAKKCLKKLLVAFPVERTHVSVFNTIGRELVFKSNRASAIEAAFRGHSAGGGTIYATGVKVLSHHKPAANEDALIIFIGDELDHSSAYLVETIRNSGINPVALGILRVSSPGWSRGEIVHQAAAQLALPLINLQEEMFTSDDPYLLTRTLRDLISSAEVPRGVVVRSPRKSLVSEILETKLLEKPAWAA